jgi:hypothetical protein
MSHGHYIFIHFLILLHRCITFFLLAQDLEQ